MDVRWGQQALTSHLKVPATNSHPGSALLPILRVFKNLLLVTGFIRENASTKVTETKYC